MGIGLATFLNTSRTITLNHRQCITFIDAFLKETFILKTHFLITVPPQILNENEDGKAGEIITKEGETVNVVCNVSGIPVPSVKWYRRPLTDTTGSKKESKWSPTTTTTTTTTTKYFILFRSHRAN